MSVCHHIKYKVTEIKWETDGDNNVNLPSETIVYVPVCNDPEEYITDYISDTYGYLHNGYKLEKM